MKKKIKILLLKDRNMFIGILNRGEIVFQSASIDRLKKNIKFFAKNKKIKYINKY